MANQTPDDGYIKDLLARLRANIDSDTAEEAEKEAELEKKSAPAPIDVYDSLDEDGEEELDDVPPFALDDDEPFPKEDASEEIEAEQEDVFEQQEAEQEEQEYNNDSALPAYAQADPFISADEEEEESISFYPASAQEEEDIEEADAPAIDVYASDADENEGEEAFEDDDDGFEEEIVDGIEEDETEEAEESLEDEIEQESEEETAEDFEELEEEDEEEDEPYFVEPIINKPLFEEVPSDSFAQEIEPSEEIEHESFELPQAGEADVAFGLAVAPVREGQSAPKAEAAPAVSTRKESLLPPYRGLVRINESYDNVFEKGLAENELCPHSDRETMAETNLTLTAARTFATRRLRAVFATVATGVLALFTLLYETIPSFALAVLSALGLLETKGMAHALDFAVLLVATLIFIPKIKHSILALRERVVSPDFAVFICASVTALFLLVRIFAGNGIFVFAALPAVFALFVAQLCHMLSLLTSITNAQICLESEGGATTVLRSPSELPDVKAALGHKVAEKRQIMSVARFSDQGAFLKKLSGSYLSPRFSLLSLIVSGALALICALFYGFVTSFTYVADVFSLFSIVLCASVSLSLFMLHSYAYRRLCRVLHESKMAVAGEGAVYEGADADVLCYADLEAIPQENVEVVKIKLSGNHRMDLVFGYLGALFAKVGGPLDGHFRVSGETEYKPKKVVLTEVEEDGISAVIDGVTFCAGRGAYMQRHGIPFYYDAEDEIQLENEKTAIMFTAMDGVGSAKLYLRYSFSESFEKLVCDLEKEGVSTIIRTCDPNVTPALLSRIAGAAKGKVGIIRNRLTQEAPAVETVTDGLVAYGVTPKGIYKTRFLFAAYRRMQQRMPLVACLIAPVCALVCTVMALYYGYLLAQGAQGAGLFSVPLWALLCQLFSALPLMVMLETVLRKFPVGDDADDQ